MSVKLDTFWICSACNLKQQATIKKPNTLIPVIVRTCCKDCQSLFLFSVLKIAGKLEVMWTVINYTLSIDGKAKFDLRNAKPTITAPALPAET